MIKLNTNENPYPPAPGVTKALLRRFTTDTLRLYPDPTAGDLVHAIAQNYGLKDEQVFVGVGSDDVGYELSYLFSIQRSLFFFPDITSIPSMMCVADLFQIPYECKALMRIFASAKEGLFLGKRRNYFPKSKCATGWSSSLI